jgi:uncharacterized protein
VGVRLSPTAPPPPARKHEALEGPTLQWMLVGAIPGTAGGLVIVGQVDAAGLAILVGAVTLVGVAMSVLSPPVAVRPSTSATAGLLSNLFGTASSVGGPPVALLFQHRPGRVARPTLSAFFAVSASLSLVGYLATGTVTLDQLRFTLMLAPFGVGGFWLSRHLHGLVDAGWLRPAVLSLSAVAGLTAILRAVL